MFKIVFNHFIFKTYVIMIYDQTHNFQSTYKIKGYSREESTDSRLVY